MKISVIIPVHNEEKYIKTCLESLQKQKTPADEVVVVDNNCNDRTLKLAKQFRTKIIKEKRQGITFARNSGFNQARYEIIARCDADSILPSDWISKIKKNFTDGKIDGLTGPVIFYDFPFKTPLFAIFYMLLEKFLQRGETLNGPNMAITKKIWEKVRDNLCHDDKKVHEDIDLSLHIMKTGGKIRYDWSLISKISARRIKYNPLSFFVEYPIRLFKTLLSH